MTISFYGTESAGSVANRPVDTSRRETTGSVGARANNDSIFAADNELKQDTVCFRGSDKNKKTNGGAIFCGTLLGTALVVGGLGLLHKKAPAFKSDKVKNAVKHIDFITKPCYQGCSWVKKNCYDKVVKFFHKG